MPRFIVSLALGVVAGVVDVLPMLVMQSDVYACASAFVHWVLLGIVISYLKWDIRGWIKGLIIAAVAAVPVALMVYPVDTKGVIPILIISPLLGSLVGYASQRLNVGVNQSKVKIPT